MKKELALIPVSTQQLVLVKENVALSPYISKVISKEREEYKKGIECTTGMLVDFYI